MAAATASGFGSVVVVADGDVDVGIVDVAHPESATSPPTYARRSCGPLRATRSNGSRIRQRHRRPHRSPDCRFARPAGGYG